MQKTFKGEICSRNELNIFKLLTKESKSPL